MNTRSKMRFGTRFMLATVLATFAGFAGAQDTGSEGVDDFEPAVDTSAVPEPTADSPAQALEQEDAGPAPLLAEDVTRQQSGTRVMDRIELGRTEITGNQELPKVLYIVPWRRPDPGQLMGRPVNTLLDEVLAPLDREEFIRQVDYYDDLYGEGE